MGHSVGFYPQKDAAKLFCESTGPKLATMASDGRFAKAMGPVKSDLPRGSCGSEGVPWILLRVKVAAH